MANAIHLLMSIHLKERKEKVKLKAKARATERGTKPIAPELLLLKPNLLDMDRKPRLREQ